MPTDGKRKFNKNMLQGRYGSYLPTEKRSIWQRGTDGRDGTKVLGSRGPVYQVSRAYII